MKACILKDTSPDAVKRVQAVLTSGQVLLYPTDTIYGLGCDACNSAAVSCIRDIKGRKQDHPFLTLAGSLETVQRYFSVSVLKPHLKKIWPGPFTVLLHPTGPGLRHIAGPSGKIGVRVAEDTFLKQLFKEWQGLLISTSANLTGLPYRHDREALEETFGSTIDLFIFREHYPINKPSAVIEWDRDGWSVIRKGPVPVPVFK